MIGVQYVSELYSNHLHYQQAGGVNPFADRVAAVPSDAVAYTIVAAGNADDVRLARRAILGLALLSDGVVVEKEMSGVDCPFQGTCGRAAEMLVIYT